MKITKLTIHNFLKFKDVEVNPQKVNVIVGKNKQGKTSILKAIQVAFTGKADEKMIHDNEDKAEITIDMDDYRIERKITRKGNYLSVIKNDGWQTPAPQKFLDGLIGQFSFNPVEFFNLKSADKKKYLLQAIDIKLTPDKLNELLGEKVDVDLNRHGLEVISELYRRYYSERTQLNAVVSKKEKTIEELSKKLPENFDNKETGAVLSLGIDKIRKAITASAVNKTEKDALMAKGKKVGEDVRDWMIQIQELQKKVENGTKEMEEIKAQVESIVIADTTELEKELATIESRRGFITIANQIAATSKELEEDKALQIRTDGLVKRLGKEIPEQLIKEANLPVEGLKVEEDSISLNGIDVEQLSASEQLSFALQVVRKLNGEFKIINIDGVEILDKETFAWFLNEIEKDDFQYFITRVDGDKGFFVEDGKVSKK